MNEAVFISDLHLHPKQPEITLRFKDFLAWAEHATKAIYILGDFFHVWLGDDEIDDFAKEIAQALKRLQQRGIQLYWMPGNRDFLMGQRFLTLAGLTALKDPSLIILPGLRIMLSHGDAYCVHDYAHQLLRFITRNAIFKSLFCLLPFRWRKSLGMGLRQFSQNQKKRPTNHKKYSIGQHKLFKHMLEFGITQVIYGHIHRPQIITSDWKARRMYQYILSDWDANPKILCYNLTKGFYFIDLAEV